jgi:hypothetical protein
MDSVGQAGPDCRPTREIFTVDGMRAPRPSPTPRALSQWGPVFDEPPLLMRPDWEVLVGAVVDRGPKPIARSLP